jgi:hypothetical protein
MKWNNMVVSLKPLYNMESKTQRLESWALKLEVKALSQHFKLLNLMSLKLMELQYSDSERQELEKKITYK